MMSHRILLACLLLLITSCKDDILDELNEDLEVLAGAQVLYEGTFVSANNYTVTGSSRIVSLENKKYLIFENFSSTSGPDLKVYISKEVKPTAHLDLGDLKAISGNFNYELPTSFDFNTSGPHILVYCERFERLFGSAELKSAKN